MASQKKASAAVGKFIIAAAVIFFISILVFALMFRSDGDAYAGSQADYGMRFDDFAVEIDWNDDRTCKITQTVKVRFYESSHGIYVDIPVNSGEKVRDLKIETQPSRPYSLKYTNNNKLVRAVVGDPDIYFARNDVMQCKITYDYITPKHPNGSDILAINAIGAGWTCLTKHATVTVNYPAAPIDGSEYGIWIGSKKYNGNMNGVSVDWSNDGKTVKIELSERNERKYRVPNKLETEKYALAPFEKVELAYEMPTGTLKSYDNYDYIVTLVIGIALVVCVLLIKILFARNNPIAPVVDFYPPYIDGDNGRKRRMLPVQMGKIVDNSCSAQDVTSLIFYWASEGFLSIEERDGETYLKRIKDVDAVTAYERKMFNKIFSYAKTGEDGSEEVALSNLSGKFANTVMETKQAVDSEYKGKFYDGRFSVLSAILSVLCGLYGVLVAMLTTLRIGSWFINPFGLFAVVPAFITAFFGKMLCRYYFKLEDKQRKISFAVYATVALGLALVTAVFIPLDASSWLERIILAVSFGTAAAVAPFISVRTRYYNEQLSSIIGFRDFLRDAEKDRLETLLADDPQYYYNILPYANVLGVSDIWADKFKGLEMEPPTYYSSDTPTLFDIMVITSLTRSVGNSLTYMPSSSGSSSGGGGGGFSGGSFGGGGGGRW